MFATSMAACCKDSHLWLLTEVLIKLAISVFFQSHLLFVWNHLSWRVIYKVMVSVHMAVLQEI